MKNFRIKALHLNGVQVLVHIPAADAGAALVRFIEAHSNNFSTSNWLGFQVDQVPMGRSE